MGKRTTKSCACVPLSDHTNNGFILLQNGKEIVPVLYHQTASHASTYFDVEFARVK